MPTNESQPELQLAAKEPTSLRLGGTVEIAAAAAPAEGEAPKRPTFKISGYSGAVVRLANFYTPVIIDLAGLKTAKAKTPILRDHDAGRIVGQADQVDIDGQGVRLSGAITGDNADAQEVVSQAKNGFEWQASIGASIDRREFLDAGKTAKVNGREVTGPLLIARASTLVEVSFVAAGADSNTAAEVAASFSNLGAKDMDPEFKAWLESKGFATDLPETQLAALKTAYTAGLAGSQDVQSLDEVLREKHRNQERVQAITRLASQALDQHPTQVESIGALSKHAIDAAWQPDKFELELLRATRPSGRILNLRRETQQMTPQVIEAALAMACSLPDVEKQYKPETLEAVDRLGMRRSFSLQQLIMQVACDNGYPGRPGERISVGNCRAVLRHAMPPADVQLGFSTLSLPDILGNVANKMILAGYMEEDATWREIAAIKNVSNFHQHTHYRMLDSLEYEEVGPGGELYHGTLGEESYTTQAKTYGKTLGITRTQIINDDLGAFDELRERLGRGAAKKFNNVFWAAFMDNSAFFTSGLTNYISGSTTNLGLDGVGLELGITAYRQMKTPAADGQKRIGVSNGPATKLVVPPTLEFIALRHYASLNVNTGGSSSVDSVPNGNIHAGKYRPIVQNRLSDTAFTGASDTAWYLFGAAIMPMVVTLLNGNATPIVESVDAAANFLGIEFQAYHDWGCDKAEPLAGIKSKGAN